MSPNKILDRLALELTGFEYAWFGHAILTTIIGIVSTPAAMLTLALGNLTAFSYVAGTTAGCVLVSLALMAFYAITTRDN